MRNSSVSIAIFILINVILIGLVSAQFGFNRPFGHHGFGHHGFGHHGFGHHGFGHHGFGHHGFGHHRFGHGFGNRFG